MIYLDHNATTPMHPGARQAMAAAEDVAWANPSSVHRAGRRARRALDDARDALGKLCQQSPRDVVFTSGGTEANNLGLWRVFAKGGGRLLITPLEHPSLLNFAQELAARSDVQLEEIAVDGHGEINLAKLRAQLARTGALGRALVAVHAAHHETGTIQPVRELTEMVAAAGAELHLDAVQAAGRLDPSLWVGAHTTALAAHKMRGPKGIGAIVTRPTAQLMPLLRGGAQEKGLRPGTPNPIAAAGFEWVARRAEKDGPTTFGQLEALRDELAQALEKLCSEGGWDLDIAAADRRMPHILHARFPSLAGDELVAGLDMEGVCVSSGSACSAGTAEPSPAIAALYGEAAARGALRISLGETSTRAEINGFLRALMAVLGRVKAQLQD